MNSSCVFPCECVAKIDQKLWTKVREAYLSDITATYDSLAADHRFRGRISKRSIEERSRKEGWRTQREAQNIASKSVSARLSEELQEPVHPRTVKAKYSELDGDRVLDDAIADIAASAPDAEVKSKEAAYATQIKLIQAKAQSALLAVELELKKTELELKRADLELKRRQLHPPELGGLIEMILSFNYTPKQVVEELKRYWGK